MNDIYTDKHANTSSWSRKIAISIALAAGLLVTQGTALADGDRGKSRGKATEYVSIKQGHHDRHLASSRYRLNAVSHKGYRMKPGAHGKWHHDGGHGKHKHYHDKHHSHVHTTHALRPDYHVHRHGYHDPRISLGLHLGHFDLYFED